MKDKDPSKNNITSLSLKEKKIKHTPAPKPIRFQSILYTGSTEMNILLQATKKAFENCNNFVKLDIQSVTATPAFPTANLSSLQHLERTDNI